MLGYNNKHTGGSTVAILVNEIHMIYKRRRNTRRISVEEVGVVAVARCGQDVVSHNVTNGTPSEDVDDVEANRVVGFEEADVLFGPGVSRLEVGHAILLRQTLFGHVFPLEAEEHEPS